MRKYIPNIFTLFNLFCGCIGVVFGLKGMLDVAAFFVFGGIFFDFFDGFAARMLHVKSEVGKQLDSLADLVTCGLVPGIILFQLLGGAFVVESWKADFSFTFKQILPFFGFLVTLASAYRLAKFNVDERQTDSFIGLPTPANALFIVSLPLVLYHQSDFGVTSIILNEWFLLVVILVSVVLLNANISLFSLKFKNWGFKDNVIRYVFLVLCLVLLLVFQFLAPLIIIVLYILMSVLSNIRKF